MGMGNFLLLTNSARGASVVLIFLTLVSCCDRCVMGCSLSHSFLRSGRRQVNVIITYKFMMCPSSYSRSGCEVSHMMRLRGRNVRVGLPDHKEDNYNLHHSSLFSCL